MPKSNNSALAVGAVALIVALVAGFFSWFQLASAEYTLPDGYGAAYAYATGGASALSAYSGLGSALASAAINSAIEVVAFALVLVFWPAMLVSGLINEVGRTIRWQPALWGLLALVFAWVMMGLYNLGSVGYGAYILDLLAVLLFLVAYILARRGTSTPTPKPASPMAPATPPEQPILNP